MYKIAKDIDIEYLNENNIIVDLNSGKFFGVNEISALIIDNISNDKSEDEIAKIICHKFNENDFDKIVNDISELIEILLSEGIIMRTD